MSMLTLKINAAKTTRAWQLALDKFPFDTQRPNAPLLTRPDDRGKEQSIKPHRLREIKERANAAAMEWKDAIARNLRFLDSLEKQHGHRFRCVTLVNSSRLLLHLGRASVLENVGLYCDRTTGLPVIPGSAVKGVLSTWACWAERFSEVNDDFREFSKDSVQRRRFTSPEAKLATRIFGDDSSTGSTAAGEMIFVGAFPVEPPVLELDIVTPHTDPTGRDLPGPIPNPFLAIAAGTEWSFAFIAKPRDGSASETLLEQSGTWLAECLEQAGIGAKTAAGYGRFLTQARWNELTLDDTALEARRVQQEKEKTKAATLATIRASSTGDYANETTFQNLVINRLNKPGEYQLLQAQVKMIVSNPENAPWIEKIIAALSENKDARKRLKNTDWFPKTWFPQ